MNSEEKRSGPRGFILFNMFIMEEKVWMELKQTVLWHMLFQTITLLNNVSTPLSIAIRNSVVIVEVLTFSTCYKGLLSINIPITEIISHM